MIRNGISKKMQVFKSCMIMLLVFVCMAGLSVGARAEDSDVAQRGVAFVQMGDKRTPIVLRGDIGTVNDVLKSMNIIVSELDQVTPTVESKISDGDVITLVRREYVNKVETGVVPFETVYTYSIDTPPGTETVLTEGVEGYGQQTYKLLMVNGVEESRELISENLTQPPVTKEIATGFKMKPVSSYDFEWDFTEEREPSSPVNVLRGQRSTAYTATGNRTSTGLPAAEGHVAVNPNVIPYGSKLFIQSSDGSFVYGYAIAADTGGAMMSGSADIDLYFDTLGECVTYGVKSVDVFVLA